MTKSNGYEGIAVLKRDVQMRIGYSALRSESSSIIFFILLEEFAFSDSIISDFAQNSCSRYSDTFWVPIPKGFILGEPQALHVVGKLYCALQI